MDKIIGKVVEKVEEHQQRHSQPDKQAPILGSESGPGMGMGNRSGSGNAFSHQDDIDLRGAAHHAASHPNTNESPEFFSSILDQLSSKKQQVALERINEAEAIAHHKAFYDPESSTSSNFSPQTSSSSSAAPSTYQATAASATSQSMGTAAALQALKLFTSSGPSSIPSAVGMGSAYNPASSFSPASNTLGPAGASSSSSSSSSGSHKGISQTAQSILVGMAMSQAAKLFEQQASRGNLASEANKESAVMKAGEMALRLFLQSQRDSGPGNKFPAAGPDHALGGFGGGGNQMGAAPGLLNLAGRLMAA